MEYSDTDLNSPQREVRVSAQEAKSLPRDGLLGSGAVEIVLTHLLA